MQWAIHESRTMCSLRISPKPGGGGGHRPEKLTKNSASLSYALNIFTITYFCSMRIYIQSDIIYSEQLGDHQNVTIKLSKLNEFKDYAKGQWSKYAHFVKTCPYFVLQSSDISYSILSGFFRRNPGKSMELFCGWVGGANQPTCPYSIGRV